MTHSGQGGGSSVIGMGNQETIEGRRTGSLDFFPERYRGWMTGHGRG